MPSMCVTDLPKDRETRICCLAAGASSTPMQGVPPNSKTVFSKTTLNWRRSVATSARSRSSTVRTPPALSCPAILRPTPPTSPTSVADIPDFFNKSGAYGASGDTPRRRHMWSIITWKSHLSPRRITLRPRWHPPSPVKGPSIGNPPTFIGGSRCTFVTWPNTEQDRRQCSRPSLAFKRLHLCTRHNAQSGATQSSTLSPSTRWNSRVLCVTSVALSARAWQAIHRSFAPIGVPASLRRVNCSA